MNVAVIGASDKPDRYSHKAVLLLEEKGHTVYPVHQRITKIGERSVYRSVKDIPDPVDTVTLYVAANISDLLTDDILKIQPRRIIFNPGAENPDLAQKAHSAGIEPVEACTLVMLRTGQF